MRGQIRTWCQIVIFWTLIALSTDDCSFCNLFPFRFHFSQIYRPCCASNLWLFWPWLPRRLLVPSFQAPLSRTVSFLLFSRMVLVSLLPTSEYWEISGMFDDRWLALVATIEWECDKDSFINLLHDGCYPTRWATSFFTSLLCHQSAPCGCE